MKKLLTAYLPALALIALGGCASTSGLASTEDDGVYYSSRDRTTAVVRSAPTTSTNEAANPDYNGNTGTSSARQGSGSDEYYDNSYTYMQGVRPGVTYYTPYSPYTTLSYGASSYGYGGGFGYGGGYGGYSPYGGGFYDPFYSPFYSPYGYGYGSGLTISFGFGRPWGYGSSFGYGRPYGGYGYGYGGFYDPYYYGGPFYGGYYGRGGYYGNNYYGNNYYGNNGSYYGDNNGRGRNSGGHRDYRSSDGRYQQGNGAAGTVSGNNAGGGRIRPDDLMAPTSPQSQPAASESRSAASDGGRNRMEAVPNAPDVQRDRTRGSFNQPTTISGADQPRYRDMEQQAGSRQMTDATRDVQRDVRPSGNMSEQPAQDQESRNRNNRWRSADNATQLDQSQPATTQPQENTRRRGGLFQSNGDQPRQENAPQQATEQQRRSYDQPRQERVFEQPQQQRQPEQRQRSFEQPQQQRSFEQPQQRQRSFEQPQRSFSQPSFSSPSGGGGGGGGGGGRGRGRGE